MSWLNKPMSVDVALGILLLGVSAGFAIYARVDGLRQDGHYGPVWARYAYAWCLAVASYCFIAEAIKGFWAGTLLAIAVALGTSCWLVFGLGVKPRS